MWDINAPPSKELGDAYDIVVASNVLHCGTNLAGAVLCHCVLLLHDLQIPKVRLQSNNGAPGLCMRSHTLLPRKCT